MKPVLMENAFEAWAAAIRFCDDRKTLGVRPHEDKKLSGSDPIKNGNLFESRKGFFFWTGYAYSPKSVVDAMLKELIYTQERIL